MSKDRPPVFTPLDREELEKYRDPEKIPGHELMMVTFEGPNGVGKTAIFETTLNAVQAAHAHIYDKELMPPVIGVAEPPNMRVALVNSERFDVFDTYRKLAKSGVSVNGLFSADDLSDPRTQAGLFLLSRRFVEKEAFEHFPIGINSFHPYWILPKGFHEPGIRVRNREQLSEVGLAILAKDRGTGSTCVYQATNEEHGAEIRRQINWAYREKFLRRENMTILIMPRVSSLVLVDGRDADEPDQYSEIADLGKYRSLYEDAPTFSRKLVELRNDPTGKSNSMISSILLATMLIVAEEQRLKEEVEIKEGKPFEINFHMGEVMRWMDWDNRLDSRGFFIDKSLILGGDIGMNEFRPWRDYNYVNGDVGITEVNYDRVGLVIERGLEDRLKEEGQGQGLDDLYQRFQ